MMKKCFPGKCWCALLAAGAAVLVAASPALAQKGACCQGDGTCDVLSQITCQNDKFGAYQGDGTLCEDDGSGSPFGCADCNCDGVSDAKAIADCVATCVGGGGDNGQCFDACAVSSSAKPPVPKDCTPEPGVCDDDDPCTVDVCTGTGLTPSSTGCTNDPVDCSDGSACTADVCVPEPDNGNPYTCVSTADDSLCDDGLDCTDDVCNLDPSAPTKDYAPDLCNLPISDELDPARCEVVIEGDTDVIADLNVGILIQHTFRGDITVTVEHKDTGTSATLYLGTSTDVGGDNNIGDPGSNTLLVFDDEAARQLDLGLAGGDDGDSPTGSFRPWTPLSVFDGETKEGTWSVEVEDAFGGDDGFLEAFELNFENRAGGCSHDPIAEVDDGLACTVDSCKETQDGPLVSHIPDDAACDNGDNCPDVCDPENENANGDGCVLDSDKDGDGTCDPKDCCPNDPTKVDPGVCGCGNSDADKDGDGVEDCIDPCKNDPKTDSVTGWNPPTPAVNACRSRIFGAGWVDCAAEGCTTAADDQFCIDQCVAACVAAFGAPASVCEAFGNCGADTCSILVPGTPGDPPPAECTEVAYKAIIRSEKSGLNTVPTSVFLPDEDTVHLQNGCFVIEVWVQETTDAKSGLACAFADFAWKGSLACQPKWTLINWNDTFDQFRAGTVDNNSGEGANLGGCTLLQGVGIFPRWHRLATLHYDGNHPKCKNEFNLSKSEKGASLMDVGEAKTFQFGSALLDIECLGYIYDLAPSNRDVGPQPEVQPADFALFAPCWMAGGDDDLGDCADVDWDCDGVIGPGDLNFFATAWQKEVCAPGIVVPACQLHCNTDATSNGVGTLTSRGDYLPWATRETIREFGLPVPPRGWAGWALDPSHNTDRVKTRRGGRLGTR